MASTYSTNLRLELMTTGEKTTTWGIITNTNLGTLLEEAISGVASVTHDDSANYTLTASNGASDESRNMVLEIGGTLTASRNVVCPTSEKLYFVKNATTGGFSITIKTSGGTGITIPNGSLNIVYCDGTNVVDAMTNLSAGATIGGLTIVDLSSAQTLTNKTLTTPVISSISNTGVVTLPTATTTLVGRDTTDTLTNKTIVAGSNTISGLTHGSQVDNPSSGVHGVTGSVVGTTDTQTLTGKTIAAASNTISGLSHGSEVNNPSSGVHGVTGSVVGTTDTQTLTNKTLTAPVIATVVNTGTLTLPTSTDTLVGRATTDTLTNKTLTSPTVSDPTISGTATISGDLETQAEVRSTIKTLTSATSIAVTMTDQSVQFVTLDHNATFTISGDAAGQWVTLIIKQGTTGGTGAFSGVDVWMNGGSAPTLSTTTGEYDIVNMFVIAGPVVIASHVGP